MANRVLNANGSPCVTARPASCTRFVHNTNGDLDHSEQTATREPLIPVIALLHSPKYHPSLTRSPVISWVAQYTLPYFPSPRRSEVTAKGPILRRGGAPSGPCQGYTAAPAEGDAGDRAILHCAVRSSVDKGSD